MKQFSEYLQVGTLKQEARRLLDAFVYAFPFHRVIYSIKNNHALLAFWVLLWLLVGGHLGKTYGISYLFLDPEYLNAVNYWSFFVMGMALGGFIMAFHITCYILDGYRYSFLGTLPTPLLHFCINNSLIPLAFILYYAGNIAAFQYQYEHDSIWDIALKLSGFFAGNILMFVASSGYFNVTNRRIFRIFADSLDKQLKKGRLQRVNVMERLNKAKQERIILHTYFLFPWLFKPIDDDYTYDKGLILKVFDQTQLNAILIQLIILISLLVLGLFRDYKFFQLPAAASLLVLLSMLLMLSGAISYWFKEWALTLTILAIIAWTFLPAINQDKVYHQAFGMDYGTRASYTLDQVKGLSALGFLHKDKQETERILERWKAKQGKSKPIMVFVCASGGGLRATIWTMRTLQYVDSATQGRLMKQTALMTGSSGGAIGTAYFRELYLRRQRGQPINPYGLEYIDKLALDKLNATIYSFVVADLMFRFQKFEVAGKTHYKDRGYSLERQFLLDTDSLLDKSIMAYRQPEMEAQVPMMLIAPTIVNDGRKLYISPLNVSYMNVGTVPEALSLADTNRRSEYKIRGIEFRRFFDKQNADSLRFMTALRMNATFPYVTPNVMLPSEPPMGIMDAGLADNFGVEDAAHFIHVFRKWISENTGGVVVVSIRGIPREEAQRTKDMLAPVSQWTAPITGLLGNLFDLQDIDNETELAYVASTLSVPVHTVGFEYINELNKDEVEEASVSWRLTTKEKKGIIDALHSTFNQASMQKLLKLLGDN